MYRALRDGRLAKFEVVQGTRRLLQPGVVEYLRSGAIRPRADSPWFGRDAAPAGEPAEFDVTQSLLPDGWPAAGDAEPLEALPECWDDPEDWEPFGRLWGRWDPDETLTDQQFWEHCAEFVKGWMADPAPPVDSLTVVSWYRACTDAVAAVAAGCRWDGEQWAARAAELDAESGVADADGQT
jgi:hypothetical protein